MTTELAQKQTIHLNIAKCKLTTLAPLFIGCGFKIDQSQYYSESDKLFVCNEPQFVSFLNQVDAQAFQEYRKLLGQISSAKAGNMNRQVQPNLRNFFERYPRLKSSLLEYPQTFKSFQLAPNHFFRGSVTGDVTLFHHNALGFYIPGSSIKGAIRQILLAYLCLEQDKAFILNASHSAQRIESMFLRGFHDERTPESALSDFLRCLRVSDTPIISDNSFYLTSVFSINMEKTQKAEMKLYQLALKPGVSVPFSMTLDERLIQQFQSCHPNIPFRTFTDLLEKITITSQKMQGLIDEQIDESGILTLENEIIKVINGISIDKKPLNFYVGGNTGFDRHSLLGIFDYDKDILKRKKEILPSLPKPRRRDIPPPKRDQDEFAPRCIRASLLESGDYTTFGWCHLQVMH